ncbi:indolepyruvate oxidoreductase subunit beta family protein [Bradyrhizobium sp.]|uniref:indolepyruvate oxidoreductase subunit beta family protein n=1 Tax=Bradyrhizobium sp. TaxID=376 RepID=UPI001DFADE8F|nr:indolepyruvate oxidoreductase subunit beta family protein [Bradyrhizobium sp.]MBI5321228.1 indolepyruvate oxidoreductase subunit beta family protein [Bradyrhizobium sp.]
MNAARSINIAILAMGGEGGGVLADWLVKVGESSGYLAQTTSVPGVSQRTGATIYYLELFPKSALPGDGRMPVLGLMPMPGDVDLVVASELMEAGRAIQRGLVTPDRTHLVTSTHRVYSMTERTALEDGRVDADAIIGACEAAARKLTGFDMARLAEANRSVISAALFGAIAGSQALPFGREACEAAIRSDGVGVSASLAAFAAAFAAAERPTGTPTAAGKGSDQPAAGGPDAILPTGLDGEARALTAMGIARTAEYQDKAYAREYVERLTPFVALASSMGHAGQQLLSELARQLALGMTYEDTIRVAELKIRRARFDRVRAEVGADPGQVVEIVEFMHPRTEEIADTMPASTGRWILRNRSVKALLNRLTSRGRMVRTTSLRGFLLLYCVASLKPLRRGSLRHAREMHFIGEWLESVRRAAGIDAPLAIAFARLRNLVKGYGDTNKHGHAKYQAICTFMSDRLHHPSAAMQLRGLIAAAGKDEDGAALEAEIDRLKSLDAGSRTVSDTPRSRALQAG